MSNTQQTHPDGSAEHNDALQQALPASNMPPLSTSLAQQKLLDQLIELGFAWEEASRILCLRDHLYENAEMQQRSHDNPHLQFARWLYELGEIRER